MNSIGVSLYSIALAKRNSQKYLDLGSFENGKDLFKELGVILKAVAKKPLDVTGSSRKIRIVSAKEVKRSVDGLLEIGHFGYGSSLRDVKTGNENYRRKISDAEMIPLYYCMWIPKSGTRGVLALQYFGEVGAKSCFQELLTSRFEKKYKDYSLRIRKLVSEAVIRKALEKAPIAKLRFIQHGVAKDIADAYAGNRLDPKTAHVELVIKVKKTVSIGQGARDRIMQVLQGKRKLDSVLELDGFEYQELKAEVELAGRIRTIRIGKPDGMTSKIDVTDSVEVDADGHPKKASITKVCAGLIADFAKLLN